MAETERKRPRLKDLPGGQVTELIVIVIMALAIALAVQWLLVKPYRIPSGSMEPTLDVGQRVLVNRLSHRLGSDPKVGDIITFHPPAGADETPPRCGAQQADDQPCPAPTPEQSKQTFIKRVVGVGGDRITVRDGHVIRNGKLQSESFTAPCAGGQGCDLPRPITVPRGYVFCMGDNRGASDDGRFWGPIPVGWVIRGAFGPSWPPTRIGAFWGARHGPLQPARRNLRAPRRQPGGLPPGPGAGGRSGRLAPDRRLALRAAARREPLALPLRAGRRGWLIVLDGRVAVRTPEGEEELEEGDVVCFVEGPQGAHALINRGTATAHFLMLSTRRAPAVAVYPDSDKVGVFSDDPGARVMVRRSTSVDYWDGER